VSDLSDDEFAVLLIADRGESMMPIGRWEAPVRSLLERGLLRGNPTPGDSAGVYNSTITQAGRNAVQARSDADEAALRRIAQEYNSSEAEARTRTVEIAAQEVVKLLKDRQVGKLVLRRALELLGE
jgi:hypothetical protein